MSHTTLCRTLYYFASIPRVALHPYSSDKMTERNKVEVISNKKDNERKLRSRDEINSVNKKVLFNFDTVNQLLINQPIIVSRETSFDGLYRYYPDVELPEDGTISKTTNLITNHEKSDVSRKNRPGKSIDVLPDEIYQLFHKKMKRDEKVMANEDRLRVMSDVDNLNSQLQLLNQYDWVRHLPTVVHINDLKNLAELEQKNGLAKNEIERLIRKHENWKKRFDQLTHDIKEWDTFQEYSDGDDDYTASIVVLRARREKERRRKLGPLIKLRLNNGYSLIIDPLLPPKIVKSELVGQKLQPRLNKPRISKAVVKKAPVAHVAKSLKRKNSVVLDDILDSSDMDLQSSQDGLYVFGTFVEDIDAFADEFQLPSRHIRSSRER